MALVPVSRVAALAWIVVLAVLLPRERGPRGRPGGAARTTAAAA